MGKRKKWTPLLILGKLGGWSLSDGHMDDCAYIVLWKVTYAHYVMLDYHYRTMETDDTC